MTEQRRFDTARYEQARTFLKEASKHLVATGRSFGQRGKIAVEKFGKTVAPRLKRLRGDVRQGRFKITGLAESAKAAMLGHHVSAEEREHMIREAAYFHAQKRGFVGGDSDEDWRAAEKEIDALLAREEGLLARGREAISSAKSRAGLEIDQARTFVSHWIEGKRHPRKNKPH
jgi:hypothetical protein